MNRLVYTNKLLLVLLTIALLVIFEVGGDFLHRLWSIFFPIDVTLPQWINFFAFLGAAAADLKRQQVFEYEDFRNPAM